MDAAERAAAAIAAGGAVARVTESVAGTHAAMIDVVRGALDPLGPAARMPVEAAALAARTNYAAVAGAARVLGRSSAPLLRARTDPMAPSAADQPGSVPVLAALGAAFGDRLRSDADLDALAGPMAVREGGAPVGDCASIDDPCPTIVVLVHGLGSHEAMWSRSYLHVARESGVTPLTVRYTTGQSIADSGRELAGLLERLVTNWPVAVERLVLVGHSMGGLVIREALAAGGPWVGLTTDVVTLGTPHAGAPLERVSRRALAVAATSPVIAPIAALGDERSVGIKQLGDAVVAAPHPEVAWHLVAGTLADPDRPGARGRVAALALTPLGDGMVSRASAFALPEEVTAQRVHLTGVGHMGLLGHREVAEILRGVLTEA